jgi:taurine dioxygenase
MAAMPDAVYPLVRTHPETGRLALYPSPNHMEQVVGFDRAESNRLLDEFTAHATQPKHQSRHKWRQGDVVIWDNRCTMHKANADYPDGEERVMHRVVAAGTAPVPAHPSSRMQCSGENDRLTPSPSATRLVGGRRTII